MKILVVDDNATNVRLLVSFFNRQNYEVVSASNGLEAIELFKQDSPDLVLMDIMMPGMDGRECASKLKQLAGDKYIPIIYVTALSQEAALATALAADGDDFVNKPINFDILMSKVHAHSRIQELNAELIQKNTQLAQYTLSLERDQELAAYFFDKALKHSYLDPGIIRHHLTSAKAFNGDLLMAAPRPGGGIYLILGDFTGHGLGASIGSLPVSQTFFNLAKNSCWIGDIARALNRELHNLLPDDMFLAATLVELNSTGERLSLWTGGLPDAYLIDPQKHTHRIIKSAHPPLGILSDERFNPATDTFEVHHGEHLYLYTDGVIEAHNPQGETYGSTRLHELFLQHETDVFDEVINEIQEFIGPGQQADDTSFVALICQPIATLQTDAVAQDVEQLPPAAIPYHLSIRLTDKELKNKIDAVSYFSEMICATNLAPYKGIIHTILAEMYTNMLEHGLLHLDSTQKNEDIGFIHYYDQKDESLQLARDLVLDVNVVYELGSDTNRLTITMSHNGDGNNEFATTDNENIHDTPGGRGMLLLENLCEDVEISDGGRSIKAVYQA
jgi:CheY-like chemotaxis protein